MRLKQLNKRSRFQMKNPDSIPITNIFILQFLSTAIQSNGNLLFIFFRSDPGIKHAFLFEIEVIILDFQPHIYLQIDESCRIEGNIGIDIFLIIEAGIKVEDAILGRYLY